MVHSINEKYRTLKYLLAREPSQTSTRHLHIQANMFARYLMIVVAVAILGSTQVSNLSPAFVQSLHTSRSGMPPPQICLSSSLRPSASAQTSCALPVFEFQSQAYIVNKNERIQSSIKKLRRAHVCLAFWCFPRFCVCLSASRVHSSALGRHKRQLLRPPPQTPAPKTAAQGPTQDWRRRNATQITIATTRTMMNGEM
jgi:hypothetical protein